jgi:hypothetical protein
MGPTCLSHVYVFPLFTLLTSIVCSSDAVTQSTVAGHPTSPPSNCYPSLPPPATQEDFLLAARTRKSGMKKMVRIYTTTKITPNAKKAS